MPSVGSQGQGDKVDSLYVIRKGMTQGKCILDMSTVPRIDKKMLARLKDLRQTKERS